MYVRNIANVRTMSVNFLHILAYMGVVAREKQYNKSESSRFSYMPTNKQKYKLKTDEAMGYNCQ